MSFLSFAEGLELRERTLVELYIIDLAIVVAFGYLLYKVTLMAGENRLPEVLERLEVADEGRDSPQRSSRTGSDREDLDRR